MKRDKYIDEQIERHFQEFKKAYPKRELFAICLQGSQNYGLDIYTDEYKSDVDSSISWRDCIK